MPDIGPGQKAALLETYAASISLLPFSLRAEFLVILGSKRETEDVDFAITFAALFAFEEAAYNNPCFFQGYGGFWLFAGQDGGGGGVRGEPSTPPINKASRLPPP